MTTSFKSANRFPASSGVRSVMPVTLPPGRAKLCTSPTPTGSPLTAIMIGIVDVACLAASMAGVWPSTTMASTFNWTKSFASELS